MRSPFSVLSALFVVMVTAVAGPAAAQEPPPTTTTAPAPTAAPTATTSTTAPAATSTTSSPTTTAPAPTTGVPLLPPEPEPGVTTPTSAGAQASLAASQTRYFGDGPYLAIRQAVAATSRSCALSDDGLTAMAMAPIFKESSAATTAASAPAPMTLSRHDEWTGIYPTSAATESNSNSNYSLYAFRDPDTSAVRAYWHPGVGIWQYDGSGLGAPFTAAEVIDVRTVAADVARGMAGRYCGAAGSDLQRRYAAWGPWGNPCVVCEDQFQAFMTTSPRFDLLQLVPMSVSGGMQRRTCLLGGASTPCWFVNPAVAEGATGWRTRPGGEPFTVRWAPDDMAPLSLPFYVVERGGYEERHWLDEDTPYTDIRARRRMGFNPRYRPLTKPGSGLSWFQGSGLCDLTAGKGGCDAIPPSGKRLRLTSAGGSYQSLRGDFDGNGLDDVFWYAPGSAPDYLWLAWGDGSFLSLRVSVGGRFRPVVGDFDGDRFDDISWYAPHGGADYLWRGQPGAAFISSKLDVGGDYRPVGADVDGNGRSDILWYAPGPAADHLWRWTGTGFSSTRLSIGGTFTRVVGDFDGNGSDDIFWYAPGDRPDSLWRWNGSGFSSQRQDITGVYKPVVGDVNGDRRDDVFWYAPGTGSDYLWRWSASAFRSTPLSVGGSYAPIAADLNGNGADELIWYAPGVSSDYHWDFTASGLVSNKLAAISASYRPIAGQLDRSLGDDVLWYGPGATPDPLWYG